MWIVETILLLLVVTDSGTVVTWHSEALGRPIGARVVAPERPVSPQPVVVYLTNLSLPRLGSEADPAIIADLTASGHLVLILDYLHHENATAANLVRDVLKLRQDLSGPQKWKLPVDCEIDESRVFILREGFRLKRDIEFARDGQRVLAMDVIYPSRPAKPVGALLEITCDNVNRMGSFSLLYCQDTLLESAQFHGFAAAMVDHPVAPPYKGIDDPMPEAIARMRSAVSTLRSLQDSLHLNGRIGAMGFSRGGPFAAILAATGEVDAALVHGNRYDYLNLLPEDPMIPRFEQAWGPLDANPQAWAIHGAVKYLTAESSPMFLNTSDAESPEYRHGLARLAAALRQLGVEHEFRVDADGRGHRVSTDPRTLTDIFTFFARHLRGDPEDIGK